MAPAGADILRKERCQLICPHFLYAAAHGKFDALLQLIIDNTGIYLFHLKQKITDQTQNVRITGVRLNDGITVIIIINMFDQGKPCYFQFTERQIGISEKIDKTFLTGKCIPHIHVQRIIDFGKLIGIRKQTIIQSGSQLIFPRKGKSFLLHHLPHQCGTASQIGSYFRHGNIGNLYLVMVNNRHVLR